MAQRTSSRAAHAAPSVEDVRDAVLHLLDLAACFEHRPTDAQDRAAESALRQATQVLLAHRRRCEATAERSGSAYLARWVAVEYERFCGDEQVTLDELEKRIRWLFAEQGIGLTAGQTTALVVSRAQIHEHGGPIQAACENVGILFQVRERQMFNRLVQDALPFEFTGYKDKKSGRAMLAYVLALLGFTSPEIGQLLDEAAAVQLKRMAQVRGER